MKNGLIFFLTVVILSCCHGRGTVDFLDEFIFGYGPEISILMENHPYTKKMQKEKRVIESQQKLLRGDADVPGQITKVGRSWKLWNVFTLSMARQFVGSYTFDSYAADENAYLLNILYDTKSVSSLCYHFPGTRYLNHSRNGTKALSTTYQFYIWKSKN